MRWWNPFLRHLQSKSTYAEWGKLSPIFIHLLPKSVYVRWWNPSLYNVIDPGPCIAKINLREVMNSHSVIVKSWPVETSFPLSVSLQPWLTPNTLKKSPMCSTGYCVTLEPSGKVRCCVAVLFLLFFITVEDKRLVNSHNHRLRLVNRHNHCAAGRFRSQHIKDS